MTNTRMTQAELLALSTLHEAIGDLQRLPSLNRSGGVGKAALLFRRILADAAGPEMAVEVLTLLDSGLALDLIGAVELYYDREEVPVDLPG